MKRFSNILVALGVTLFLMSVGMKSEAEAQCKSGYTYKKVTMTIGGCPWEIEICYKCGLTYPGEVYLIGATPIKNPPCVAVTLQEALDYAYGQLGNYDYIINILCTNTPYLVPPCPTQSQKLILNYNYCWKMKKIMYHGVETIRFLPCGTGYCTEEITFCFDVLTQSIIKTTYSFMTEPPYCSLEENEVEIPDNVGDESNCFLYHSPCNP